MQRSFPTGGKLAAATLAVALAAGTDGSHRPAGDDEPPARQANARVVRARPLAGQVPIPQGALPPGAAPNELRMAVAEDAEIVVRRRATSESQLIQMLGAELRLLTATAHPTPEQRRQIALAGGRALRQARGVGATNQVRIAAIRRPESPDPHRLIRDALAAAAIDRVGTEAGARYLREWDARDQARQQAATVEIVARLDEALLLNDEQRDRIATLIRTQADSPIFPSPASLAKHDGSIPAFLPHLIGEALTREQAKLLASLPLLNFGRMQVSPFDAPDGVRHSIEDEADDPDLKAALAEAGRP